MDFDAEDVEELDARKRVQRQPTGLTRPGVHPAGSTCTTPRWRWDTACRSGCLATCSTSA